MDLVIGILGYIFLTRILNILMGVFFWDCSKPYEDDMTKYPFPPMIFWMSPLLGDVLFVANVFCFITLPLNWLTNKSISLKTSLQEKKKRELKIEQKRNEVAKARDELAEQMLDKELKELKAKKLAQ